MIYLDHHAATPLAPAAAEAMQAMQATQATQATEATGSGGAAGWANPESQHAAGRAARALRERAREAVARATNAAPADVVFTSGGTEAVTLGVMGMGVHARVVTTAIEHPAVARSVEALGAAGARVVRVPTPGGRADALDEVALDAETLVAIGWVNHETGTVLPVERLCARARAAGARVVVDATQAFGKVPVDVGALGASAVALAAHKVGGPAGAGALVVARDAPLEAVLRGGGQERGRRPGTPDVRALVGFGAACGVIDTRLAAMGRVGALRDRLEAELVARGAVVNGAEGPRVATCANVSFAGQRGDLLVAALDLEGICASSGAACSSGVAEPSPVLSAMYPDAAWRATSALRLTLGPETTDDDVTGALDALDRVLARARR